MNRFILTATFLLVVAVPVLAIDYWPDDPDGVVYRYRSSSGYEYDAVFTVDGEYHAMSRDLYDCTGGEYYLVTDDAVGLAAWNTYCPGDIDPSFDDYFPPIDFVRDGMTDGEYWMWTGVGSFGGTCIVFVEVAAATITVPLGTFETLHVSLNYITCAGPFAEYWLDRELGPVRIGNWDLVSVDGPVATEKRSWSSVKGLFD